MYSHMCILMCMARAWHVYTQVPLAGEAAKSGDASLFGALLDLEGASLRMYASLP